MTIPTDVESWLKLIGMASSGAGSLLLAWRVRVLLKWITYCVVAHEESITQITRVLDGQQQTGPVVGGTPKHLIKIQEKLGLILLVAGFLLLGIGMLSNAASYLFTDQQP